MRAASQPAGVIDGPDWRTGAGWIVWLGMAAYFITLAKCAWLSDDYFITLRQMEQLFAGHGLRFNLYERSFLSTSVAYFFILLPLRLVTSDPFVMHAMFALACNAALLWLLWVLAQRDVRVWLLGLGLLFASKAHFDYSWFGQENPLGHALAAGLILAWLRLYPGLQAGAHPPARSCWWFFVALVAVAPLYRHDFVLLAWPLAAWALWDNRGRLGWRGLLRSVALMLAPLAAWTLFSLVYFGFPLPAPAYAKVPDSHGFIYRLATAWDYYRFSLHKDGVMLAVIFASQFLWHGRGPARAIAVAVALVLLYIVFVGGDYMGGRFFSVAYVLMVAVVVGTAGYWQRHFMERGGGRQRDFVYRGLGIGLVLWIALWPHSPLRSPLIYEDTVLDQDAYPSGVANERAAWQPRTGIAVWWNALRDGTTYPDHFTARLGILLRDQAGAGETFHVCNLGLTPYKAGLDQNFVDVWGLADSFMARLPQLTVRPGHLVRDRPLGLAESLAVGAPTFADAGLNRYFGILRNVTASERLLSASRMEDLVAMNLGLHEHLIPEVIEKRESAVVMPDTENVPLLKRMLQGYRSDEAAVGTPLCYLVHHPGADALSRGYIP